MKSIFDHIYKVNCPCEITDAKGNLLYLREKKNSFLVPLSSEIIVKKGSAEFLGIRENFYDILPPAVPSGWNVTFSQSEVSRKAQILIDHKVRTANVDLDSNIFQSKKIPEGCKIFIVFHEIGHIIHGPDEAACDEFAFLHSLRAGVSPFLCYVALRAFMPEHYDYRVERLGNLLLSNPHLKNLSDEFSVNN